MRGIILGTCLKGRAGRPKRKEKATRRRTGCCGLVRQREERGAKERVVNRSPNQCVRPNQCGC